MTGTVHIVDRQCVFWYNGGKKCVGGIDRSHIIWYTVVINVRKGHFWEGVVGYETSYKKGGDNGGSGNYAYCYYTA